MWLKFSRPENSKKSLRFNRPRVDESGMVNQQRSTDAPANARDFDLATRIPVADLRKLAAENAYRYVREACTAELVARRDGLDCGCGWGDYCETGAGGVPCASRTF